MAHTRVTHAQTLFIYSSSHPLRSGLSRPSPFPSTLSLHSLSLFHLFGPEVKSYLLHFRSLTHNSMHTDRHRHDAPAMPRVAPCNQLKSNRVLLCMVSLAAPSNSQRNSMLIMFFLSFLPFFCHMSAHDTRARLCTSSALVLDVWLHIVDALQP